MHRIDFREQLTAIEIRKPVLEVCEDVASVNGLFILFRQPQQRAWSGYSSMPSSERTRIGNGKHKDWYVDYRTQKMTGYERETGPDRKFTIGTICLRAPVIKEVMEYGGFNYGKYEEPEQKYSYLTVKKPSELNIWNGIDLDEDILEQVHEDLTTAFEFGHGSLFDVAEFSIQDDEI